MIVQIGVTVVILSAIALMIQRFRPPTLNPQLTMTNERRRMLIDAERNAYEESGKELS